MSRLNPTLSFGLGKLTSCFPLSTTRLDALGVSPYTPPALRGNNGDRRAAARTRTTRPEPQPAGSAGRRKGVRNRFSLKLGKSHTLTLNPCSAFLQCSKLFLADQDLLVFFHRAMGLTDVGKSVNGATASFHAMYDFRLHVSWGRLTRVFCRSATILVALSGERLEQISIEFSGCCQRGPFNEDQAACTSTCISMRYRLRLHA